MNKYKEHILFASSVGGTLVNIHGSKSILGNNLIGKSEQTGTNNPTAIPQGEHDLNASNSGSGIVRVTLFANKSFYPQIISKGHDRVTVGGASCWLIIAFSLYPLDLRFGIDSNKVFEPKFSYPIHNKDPPFVYLSL